MDGIIVIDKPSGRTSYSVVEEVKRTLGVRKAGHTGTLDPLATGVLPICLNEATKMVQFLEGDTKDYTATMLLGVETDTLDTDGKIISRSGFDASREAIEQALMEVRSLNEQKPPFYSAVKYRGKAAYKWARKGIKVDLQPRRVEISSAGLVEIDLPYVKFYLTCSKGTYIRSICSLLGEKLGTKACLAQLRRTRNGHFGESMAVVLDGKTGARENLASALIPLVNVLPHALAIEVPPPLERKIRDGYQPSVGDLNNNMGSLAGTDVLKIVTSENRLLAIARLCRKEKEPVPGESSLKILRVFH